jgi:hypothetical protein
MAAASYRYGMQHGFLIGWLRTLECRLVSEQLGYQPISLDIIHLARRYSPRASSIKRGESRENISPPTMDTIERYVLPSWKPPYYSSTMKHPQNWEARMSIAIRPFILLVVGTGIIFMLIAALAAEIVGNLSRLTTHDSFPYPR